MKIILEAFQGKLRSEVMDWPEGTGYRILLDLDVEGTASWTAPHEVPSGPIVKRCVFEHTGNYQHGLKDAPRGAAIYRLVAVG